MKIFAFLCKRVMFFCKNKKFKRIAKGIFLELFSTVNFIFLVAQNEKRKKDFFNVVPSNKETSFQPPSMGECLLYSFYCGPHRYRNEATKRPKKTTWNYAPTESHRKPKGRQKTKNL